MESNFLVDQDDFIFDDYFNEPLDYNILSLIKNKIRIIFGSDFNQNISYLPSNITHIVLGKKYTLLLDNLPTTIKSVVFTEDSEYYSSLDYFHDNLNDLILGDNYNNKINKFPFDLKKLILSKKYSFCIEVFPLNLEYLDIGSSYTDSLVNLPISLETLLIGGSFNNFISFPLNLKYFIIKDDCEYNLELDNLPESLIYLAILNRYRQSIDKLKKIKYLYLGDFYNGEIKKFPESLIKLKFSNNFSYDFIEIPSTIKIIELYSNYLYLRDLIFKFPDIQIIYLDENI